MAKQPSSTDVTGRDGWLMAEALAFTYAAMRYLPVVFRSTSDRADMRALLFARSPNADWFLAQAMLTAWHFTHDTHTNGRDHDEFLENLRTIRAEALLEMNAATDDVFNEHERADLTVMIDHIDLFLNAKEAGI